MGKIPCAHDGGHGACAILPTRKDRGRRLCPPYVLAPIVLLIATPARAHGFGERYDLPIPLSFYLAGAAAAVVVSFLIAALFLRAGR